ncbi:Uncharacterised protein r2_g3607 [Pycnogonum litorale]
MCFYKGLLCFLFVCSFDYGADGKKLVYPVKYPVFYITSKGFSKNNPNAKYLKNADEEWVVTKSSDTVCRITADFSIFELESNCKRDSLTFSIQQVDDSNNPFCGVLTGQTKTFKIAGNVNTFKINFKSNDVSELRGFSIKITQHPNTCGKSIGELPVTYRKFRAITDDPNKYGNDIHRTWNIQRSPYCPRTTRVTLRVVNFNIEYSAGCTKDYFSFESNELEKKRCGNWRRNTVWTAMWPLQAPVLRLKMVSDGENDSGGFDIVVTQC